MVTIHDVIPMAVPGYAPRSRKSRFFRLYRRIMREVGQRADILIVAAGVPGLVKPEWIKPGSCGIDVGVNRVGEKISEKTGKKVAILRGDVDFDAAKEIAGFITPVPGGVGPMTITMLMKNTLRSLKFKLGIA